MALLTEEQLKAIIEKQIESEESLGDQVGGSGHRGHVSYKIDNISEPQIIDNNTIEVTYRYTLTTVTEFTIYPDNPPYEQSY
jgi:hypothetical protein